MDKHQSQKSIALRMAAGELARLAVIAAGFLLIAKVAPETRWELLMTIYLLGVAIMHVSVYRDLPWQPRITSLSPYKRGDVVVPVLLWPAYMFFTVWPERAEKAVKAKLGLPTDQ